jgi:cobalt-zinc-cadmium efflux system outer membrane protein
MWRRILHAGWFFALAFGCAARQANAQGPTVESGLPPLPGSATSSLGTAPGAGGGSLGISPGAGQGFLGGRPGVSQGRLPAPAQGPGPAELQAPITAPQPEPIQPFSIPLYGSLDIPAGPEDDGPPGGLTLDAAIDLALRNNLDLRGKFYEIPQAQADILQASLRANPVFYADSQLIPYQRYTNARPAGQQQYDVNISYPLDVSRKRRARTLVATRAKRVLEAQYQEAVRQTIDDIYSAFVDALAARQTVRYANKSVQGLETLLSRTQQLYAKGVVSLSDLNRVKIQLRTARLGASDAEVSYQKAKKELAALLNLPTEQAETIEVRGSIYIQTPPPPPVDEFRRLALEARPDLVAYRLGLKRAEADVGLARANRLQDVYLLFQPYTFQDNSPFGLKSGTSWALGMSIPLPIYNRNQGAIRRAELNVTQTQIEQAGLERRVLTDVEKAVKEYEFTRRAVQELRDEILPIARQARDESLRLYIAGETGVVAYINAQLEFNTAVKQYLDTAIRYRRSMLALNTAVGQRIFP